ncbi:MAG TPA: C1 family peptidase [Saprospiraceae bacterium]|nr:C1 family peptidase [Saprospiraceae bacterium]
MKKWIILSSFFYLIALASFAQPMAMPGTGLQMDDEAYGEMDLLQADGNKVNLPPEASLYAFTPRPRNQGRSQSCVGWAVGYSALTIEQAIHHQLNNRDRITEYAFSAMYVYNQIRTGDCRYEGSRITDALRFLEQEGNVLARQFDHNVEDCGRQPNTQLQQYAAQFRITDHLRLFPVDESPQQKIFKVKYALSRQKPVIIGMRIRKNFFQLDRNAKFWWPNIGDQTPAGGHAMTVVAYDDRRDAFLLMNSWGEKWGLGGFMWVKYQVFAEYCKYAFILQVEEDLRFFWEGAHEAEAPAAMVRAQTPAHPLRQMAGHFQFKFNPEINAYSPFFESAAVESRGFYYRLQRQDWPVGQQFQLEVDNLERNSYVYVFSVNSNGQVYIHWPRQEALNPHFRGERQSALSLDQQQKIYVPGENRALKISSPGRDHLVILFSKKPLSGLPNLLGQLKGSQQALPQQLLSILEPFMVPLADIAYAKDEVAFSVRTRSEGMVVPLIIEVNSQ